MYCSSSFENKQKATKISHNYLRISDLDHVLDAAVGMFLNHRLDPDQGFYLVGKKHITALSFTLAESLKCCFPIKLHSICDHIFLHTPCAENAAWGVQYDRIVVL